jgi:hypothetical protein
MAGYVDFLSLKLNSFRKVFRTMPLALWVWWLSLPSLLSHFHFFSFGLMTINFCPLLIEFWIGMLLGCLCTEYVKSGSGWRMSWKIETGKNIVTSLAESVVLERLCRIWRLGWTPIDINKPSKTHVLESSSSQLGLLLRRDGEFRIKKP